MSLSPLEKYAWGGPLGLLWGRTLRESLLVALTWSDSLDISNVGDSHVGQVM